MIEACGLLIVRAMSLRVTPLGSGQWSRMIGLASSLLLSSAVHAGTIAFDDQQDWMAALGGASVTVFHFDNPTETHNRFVNDPLIAPSYLSQGVEFLPFDGTSVYPRILRGQDYQISTPGRDGLLTNNSSPHRTVDGRAILLNFTTTVRAVGGFSNDIDYGKLEAYDANGSLLGTAWIGTDSNGGFGGLVSDTPIAHVKLINTYNQDLIWGIYDLQFSAGIAPDPTPSPVPEAGATGLLVGLGLSVLARLRRAGRVAS